MKKDIEQLETSLLFEAMYRLYGYDFRHYSYASARRRVLLQLKKQNLPNVAALQHLIMHSEEAADHLLQVMSINVTEMFRDPLFFKYLREKIVPQLSNKEHLKVWHAGCSSGEEVYSMSIILKELNVLTNTQLYASDFNIDILKHAKHGSFHIKKMRQNINQYHQSGGTEEFSQYYSVMNHLAVFTDELKNNILFSHHNLTEDGCFGEMDIIVCRNVLIYFNPTLQKRVLQLFYDSLCQGGFLCLGSHESLFFSGLKNQFKTISRTQKIFQKVSAPTP